MKWRNLIVVLVAIFALVLFLGDSATAKKKPIKFGAILPLADITGDQGAKAMKLAVKEINAKGGLLDIIEIPLHYHVSFDQNFSLFSTGQNFPCIQIHDPDLNAGERPSDTARTIVIWSIDRNTGAGLCGPVGLTQFNTVFFSVFLPHPIRCLVGARQDYPERSKITRL